MGYSSRYHAASLAAVFLALAIGILIGVGFGNDVVHKGTRDLEHSLKSDLLGARDRADALQRDLDLEHAFDQRIYPALTRHLLSHEQVALVGLGGVSDGVVQDVKAALEPTGAKLTAIAVVREPPDLVALAGALHGSALHGLAHSPDRLRVFATRAGRSLVTGGPPLRRVRDSVLARFSGKIGGIDAVVVARQEPQTLDPTEQEATGVLEGGLLDGLETTGLPVVGVERSDSDPSSIGVFDAHGLSTVDSVDLTSGRVAMVHCLAGTRGDFGIKSTADKLLPVIASPATG